MDPDIVFFRITLFQTISLQLLPHKQASMPITPYIKASARNSNTDKFRRLNADAQGAETIDLAHIDLHARSDYNRAIGAIMLDAHIQRQQGVAETDCDEDSKEWRGHAHMQGALCLRMYRVDSCNSLSDLSDAGTATPTTTDDEGGTKYADTAAKIMTVLAKTCQDDELELLELFQEARRTGCAVKIDSAEENKHTYGAFSTWLPQAANQKWPRSVAPCIGCTLSYP